MANMAVGKVTRLYANRLGTFIRLQTNLQPKEEYFRLKPDHENYNALYSLALAAAANRWPLQVRIAGDGEIDPNAEAYVSYLVVDWNT
jgi:hypothetical protein